MNWKHLRQPKYLIAEASPFLINASVYSAAAGSSAASPDLIANTPLQGGQPNAVLYQCPYQVGGTNWGNYTLPTNNIWAEAFVIAKPTRIRTARYSVATVGATESWLTGFIYTNCSTATHAIFPYQKIIEFSPCAAHLLTGYVLGSAVTEATLQPGLYWAVHQTNGGQPSQAFLSRAALVRGEFNYGGGNGTGGVRLTPAGSGYSLPATFPVTADYNNNSQNLPYLGMKFEVPV